MSRVDHALAELASSRRRLLSDLEGFDDARFADRPPKGGWSAGQVVEHLARIESGIARGAKKALAGGTLAKHGFVDTLRKALLYRTGIANDIRIRTSARLDPEAALPRAEALARLAAVREELTAAIEQTRGRDVSKLYLRHPVFGALNLHEMFEFVAWHEEHHRGQVVRIRQALGMN